MKKLVKKNRISKGQWGLLATAPIWGPYVIGALGTAAAGAAAYPYIKNIVGSLDLNDVDWGKVRDFVSFNPHFTTGKQLILPQLEALENHLYTGLGEGVPMREVVVTPETTDYTMEWNPVTGLSKMRKRVKESWNEGQTETATPEPEKHDEEKSEEEKSKENETKEENSDNSSKLRTLGNWAKNGVKYGLGTWGTASGATRLGKGILYGISDNPNATFIGGVTDSPKWMMIPALRSFGSNIYERRQKELNPENKETEENKEERDTTNTKKQSISSSGGNLQIIEIGRATKDK